MVALDLFAAHGFARTSTRQIAARAGLSDAGVYAHFASKREIFDELFRAAGPHVVASSVSRSPDIPRDRGPEPFVRAVVDFVLDRWSKPEARKFMAVILRDCTLESDAGAPSLRQGIADALRESAQIFEQWIKGRLVRDDFSSEHLAWELFSPLINLRLAYLHPKSTQADIARAKQLGRRHADFFLSSITRGSAPKSRRGTDDSVDFPVKGVPTFRRG